MSAVLIAAIGVLAAAAFLLLGSGTAVRLSRLTGTSRARGGGREGILGSRGDPVGSGTRGGSSAGGAAGGAADPRAGGAAGARAGGPAGGAAAESAADRLAFDLELVAICLQSGLTTERALALAARAGGDRSGLGRLGHSIALGHTFADLGGARSQAVRASAHPGVDEARGVGGAPGVDAVHGKAGMHGEAGAHAATGSPNRGSTEGATGAESVAEELRAVIKLIDFSRRTGVALAPLLRGLASDLRRSEHRRRQLAAARLGVTLVLPLGVCILPAFILLGIVPVVITLVSDMAGIFT